MTSVEPNNDGIDPDCCRDVIVRDCIVETGDDAIVVKATKPMSEKYGSCENILISNCILHSHDSALKIGTETHGDIRNIILSDCIAKDCSRGIGIWVRDGATIEDVHVHHLIGNVLKYADAVRKMVLPCGGAMGNLYLSMRLTEIKRNSIQEPFVILVLTM